MRRLPNVPSILHGRLGLRLAATLQDAVGKIVYPQLRARVAAKWNRTLPLSEYFVDRWDKARMLGFGSGASIYDSALVIGDVTVGENTWIGPFTILDGSGGLRIGSSCSISAGVQVYTHDTVRWATTGSEFPDRAPVEIGDHVYIGPNCVVARGVSIGDRCIVGANSFVDRDLPSGSTAWGTPARVVN